MVDVYSAGTQERFWAKVLKQPGDKGHWFWIGAIADDGYGRFSLNHHGRTDVARPHRYAYGLAHDLDLDGFGALMHLCDIPLCVRASTDTKTHLIEGGMQENMVDRQRKGRTRNQNVFTWRGLPREHFTATSRALRTELLTHGLTRPEVIQKLVAGHDPAAPTLF